MKNLQISHCCLVKMITNMPAHLQLTIKSTHLIIILRVRCIFHAAVVLGVLVLVPISCILVKRNGIAKMTSSATVRLYPNTNFPTDEGNSYDFYMRPSCSITATEVGVSGDYVTLNGVDYPIENTPSAISCNSGSNATMTAN